MSEKENKEKTPITVLFEGEFVEWIDRAADKNFCSRSAIIRKGTVELLEKILPRNTSKHVQASKIDETNESN